MAGISSEASNMTLAAPTGSTAPLRLPIRNERHRELPSASIGMEMMVPSGTFWMAIPNDTATADARDKPAAPCSAPANTTPPAQRRAAARSRRGSRPHPSLRRHRGRGGYSRRHPSGARQDLRAQHLNRHRQTRCKVTTKDWKMQEPRGGWWNTKMPSS